ncbi:hypothetical protein M427DRAFT_129946 [Gonapodya prolifera JEL478]|uniref:Uncharacterized protein n=1 Tax=Gonapodya prolifera (strain JEL478) TaxID=1344416 RepID=A0A139AZQ7_GONPJ|nr:hypothetical protein M427DRAFT_129946 [Gonapodya prolifera JEL478]|eukprot:KXS22209.1 hypothetical protein M427DRAFT_129946 [Gonapodya prolifera JEL478]
MAKISFFTVFLLAAFFALIIADRAQAVSSTNKIGDCYSARTFCDTSCETPAWWQSKTLEECKYDCAVAYRKCMKPGSISA